VAVESLVAFVFVEQALDELLDVALVIHRIDGPSEQVGLMCRPICSNDDFGE
jgi:hypothetical protein